MRVVFFWPTPNIVGGVHERSVVARRGCGRQCAPAALDWALLGGASTSPLEHRSYLCDSGIALTNLRVNGIYYGSLGVGEVTPYRKHKRIGKYVGFSFEADGVLVDRPLDNVVFGSFLGAGQFTFVLWVTNRAYPPSASLRLEHK